MYKSKIQNFDLDNKFPEINNNYNKFLEGERIKKSQFRKRNRDEFESQSLQENFLILD